MKEMSFKPGMKGRGLIDGETIEAAMVLAVLDSR